MENENRFEDLRITKSIQRNQTTEWSQEIRTLIHWIYGKPQ